MFLRSRHRDWDIAYTGQLKAPTEKGVYHYDFSEIYRPLKCPRIVWRFKCPPERR
jgi:hypothetical protein